MARIYPFRALRYDPARVDMTDVVTQPYDKITPAMQQAYYDRSKYNLIRVILGKKEPGDTDPFAANAATTPQQNVYTRAAESLASWRKKSILKQEAEPAIYGYSQTYAVPGSDEIRERRGFIALGHLYDYADHVVFRHEQTFPKHKSDRLALFKATRAYCEQIYMLYSDPNFTAEKAIFESGSAPELEITDEYGVLHRVWKLAAPELIARVVESMSAKQLIIADGHHRYETSVTYMHERAAALGLRLEADHASENCHPDPELAEGEGPASPAVAQGHEFPHLFSAPGEPLRHEHMPQGFSLGSPTPEKEGGALAPPFPEAAMMMTFVNMDAPGITILPTHRVAFGLLEFSGREFAAKAAAFFNVEEIPATTDGHYPGAPTLLDKLNATDGVAFIAATRDGDFLLTPIAEKIAPLLADLSPRQAALDVTQLHKIVIENILGLNEETVRAGSNIRYLREASEALAQVGCGNADVAFLIKPVTLEQMKDISLNLEVMPQKSTDFYPKLLSGLAMYTLD